MQGTRQLDVIREREAALLLLQPLRSQLLKELREPGSASSLSRRLGVPRQRLNYHLRELEKQGLVKFVEERRRGNCLERILRATARSYLISPEALGGLSVDPSEVTDRFSASYLMATAGQAVRDVATLSGRAEAAGKRLPTLTLSTEVRFASAEARNGFAEEMATALARLVAKYHDEQAPEGRKFRFFVGGYPTPVATEDMEKAGTNGPTKEDENEPFE